jgi:glycerol-3-phosphate acyltransferase PlsX
LRIGIDLMGGDRAPLELFASAIQAAKELSPQDALTVFTTQDVLYSLNASCWDTLIPEKSASIDFSIGQDVITMEDSPLTAIRKKRSSSILQGIQQLKDKHLDAFVSVGNTGALVAAATLKLKRLTGVHRPALLAVLPTAQGNVAILDVGGHISVKAELLQQFAVMGALYMTCSKGIKKPRVGLLNIGVESLKGTSELQKAFQLIGDFASENPSLMTFIGNLEGREVFQAELDVLVTDGFSGNIFLKTAEGVSRYLLDRVTDLCSKEEGLIQAIKPLKSHIDYEEYPGALVCGVDGIVIKCHGESTAQGLLNGIRGAAKLVEEGLIEKMKNAYA